MFKYIRNKQIQIINNRINQNLSAVDGSNPRILVTRNQSNGEVLPRISRSTEAIPSRDVPNNRFNQPYFTFEVVTNTSPMPLAASSNTNTITRPFQGQVRKSQNGAYWTFTIPLMIFQRKFL